MDQHEYETNEGRPSGIIDAAHESRYWIRKPMHCTADPACHRGLVHQALRSSDIVTDVAAGGPPPAVRVRLDEVARLHETSGRRGTR